MKFNYLENKNLPPLAWCAILTKGNETIDVLSGCMVECRRDGFVSGVWDDAFEKFDFENARYSCCSGSKLSTDWGG